jgi:hypothetical protein
VLGKSTRDSISIEADSHAFVLGFNIVALLAFVLLVDLAAFLDFGDRLALVKWIAAIVAVAFAISAYFVSRRWTPKKKPGYDLSVLEQSGLLGILAVVFVIYTRLIV